MLTQHVLFSPVLFIYLFLFFLPFLFFNWIEFYFYVLFHCYPLSPLYNVQRKTIKRKYPKKKMMCVFPSSHLLRVLHRLDVFSTTFMMSSTGCSLEWLHSYNEHLFFLHTHPNPPSAGIRLGDCGGQQSPSPCHPLLLNAPWWKPHLQIPSVHHPLCFLLK